MISNDKVTVAVPAAALFAKAGYLDASIMSFVDVFDNVRKKIGSLTARDAVEYANRVPREIFTKDVAILTSLNLYQPSKYFEGTVAAVYFVIELPDAWGPVNSTRL
jgi:hypothetical protein